MRRRRWLLLWSLAAAVAAGAGLWATGSRPPRLPADRDHTLLQPESACLHCHAHTAARPRPKGHPLRDDCFSCHRDREGVLHPRPGAALSLPGGWRDDPRFAGTPRR